MSRLSNSDNVPKSVVLFMFMVFILNVTLAIMGDSHAPQLTVLVGGVLILLLAWTLLSANSSEEWSRQVVPPGALLWVNMLVGVSALSVLVLGFIGAFIAVLLVPCAAVVGVIGWVQPRRRYLLAAGVLATSIVPLIAWIVGRGDEESVEGVAGVVLLLLVLLLLAVIRSASRLDATRAHSVEIWKLRR